MLHSAEIELLSRGAVPEEGEHRYNQKESFTVDVRGTVWWFELNKEPRVLKVADEQDKRVQYIRKQGYPVSVDEQGFVAVM